MTPTIPTVRLFGKVSLQELARAASAVSNAAPERGARFGRILLGAATCPVGPDAAGASLGRLLSPRPAIRPDTAAREAAEGLVAFAIPAAGFLPVRAEGLAYTLAEGMIREMAPRVTPPLTESTPVSCPLEGALLAERIDFAALCALHRQGVPADLVERLSEAGLLVAAPDGKRAVTASLAWLAARNLLSFSKLADKVVRLRGLAPGLEPDARAVRAGLAVSLPAITRAVLQHLRTRAGLAALPADAVRLLLPAAISMMRLSADSPPVLTVEQEALTLEFPIEPRQPKTLFAPGTKPANPMTASSLGLQGDEFLWIALLMERARLPAPEVRIEGGLCRLALLTARAKPFPQSSRLWNLYVHCCLREAMGQPSDPRDAAARLGLAEDEAAAKALIARAVQEKLIVARVQTVGDYEPKLHPYWA